MGRRNPTSQGHCPSKQDNMHHGLHCSVFPPWQVSLKPGVIPWAVLGSSHNLMRLKDTRDISKSDAIKLWPLSSKDGAKKYEESDMNNHAYSLYFSFLSLSTLLIPHSKINRPQ